MVEKVLEALPEAQIIPIPGPSALAAVLSVAGIEIDRFLFLGFLPIKKHRKEFLRQIVESEYPVVFYESPYKILKTLKEINDLKPNLKVIVAKELTKIFEKVYRGDLKEVVNQIEKDKPRGEYAVIIQSLLQ